MLEFSYAVYEHFVSPQYKELRIVSRLTETFRLTLSQRSSGTMQPLWAWRKVITSHPLHYLTYNYLTYRKQYLGIDYFVSDELPVGSGVPQRSLIGPLMFLIMMNDIDKVFENPISMHADGIKILATGNLAHLKKFETVQHKIARWNLSTSHHSYKKRIILSNILPVSLYNEMPTPLLLSGVMDGKFDVSWKDFVQLVETSSRQAFNKTFDIPMKTKVAKTNTFRNRAQLLANILNKYVNFYEPNGLKRRLQPFYWNFFPGKHSEDISCRWSIFCGGNIYGDRYEKFKSGYCYCAGL